MNDIGSRTRVSPRRKRMVVLPKRIDDALHRRARQLGQGLSPMIRAYVIDGLKRDGMLDAR